MLTRSIKLLWRENVNAHRLSPWTAKKWDEFGGLFISVPGGDPGNRYSLVANNVTISSGGSAAWCRFSYDATCYIRLGADMFFGTQGGIIMQCERTGADDGLPYVCHTWSALGDVRGRQTFVWHRAVRCSTSGQTFKPQLSATVDYSVILPSPPAAGPDQVCWRCGIKACGMRQVGSGGAWIGAGAQRDVAGFDRPDGFLHAPIVQVTMAQQVPPDVELIAIAATFEPAASTYREIRMALSQAQLDYITKAGLDPGNPLPFPGAARGWRIWRRWRPGCAGAGDDGAATATPQPQPAPPMPLDCELSAGGSHTAAAGAAAIGPVAGSTCFLTAHGIDPNGPLPFQVQQSGGGYGTTGMTGTGTMGTRGGTATARYSGSRCTRPPRWALRACRAGSRVSRATGTGMCRIWAPDTAGVTNRFLRILASAMAASANTANAQYHRHHRHARYHRTSAPPARRYHRQSADG